MTLASCPRCAGFLPAGSTGAAACPHCSPQPFLKTPIGRALAVVAGGSLLSMTLMACYGAPCVSDDPNTCFGEGEGEQLVEGE